MMAREAYYQGNCITKLKTNIPCPIKHNAKSFPLVFGGDGRISSVKEYHML